MLNAGNDDIPVAKLRVRYYFSFTGTAVASKLTVFDVQTAVAAFSMLELTALHAVTTGCGSVVLGLALLEGRIEADEAFALSQLDESFEIEQWGEDEEAERRRAAVREDIRSAAHFLALLRA